GIHMNKQRSCWLALGMAFFFCLSTHASSVTFTNDFLISGSNTNFDGKDIIVAAGKLTVNGSHTFANLHILPGAVVTHSASTNGVVQDRVPVSGESHSLAGTNSVLLNHAAFTNNLVVWDEMRETTYRHGIDYDVSHMDGAVWIYRPEASSIPDGSNVSIDYERFGNLVASGMFLTITNNLEIETGGAINVMELGSVVVWELPPA
ncbi:MAG: hypothetical protein ACK4UN_22265, partial [Limisphaerales bacterium]